MSLSNIRTSMENQEIQFRRKLLKRFFEYCLFVSPLTTAAFLWSHGCERAPAPSFYKAGLHLLELWFLRWWFFFCAFANWSEQVKPVWVSNYMPSVPSSWSRSAVGVSHMAGTCRKLPAAVFPPVPWAAGTSELCPVLLTASFVCFIGFS